jgi:hypothetical protein
MVTSTTLATQSTNIHQRIIDESSTRCTILRLYEIAPTVSYTSLKPQTNHNESADWMNYYGV